MKLLVLFLFVLSAFAIVENPNFIYYNELEGKPYTISWDKRSFMINGRRTIFLAGSVHYPRATPEMWDTVLDQAVADGLNLIQIYTFWNFHEPVEGQYVWEGRADLRLFLEKCKQRGLFVNLRIGPYVCAEWDNGGIPSWLQFKEGITYRSTNPIWEKYMSQWMHVVVDKVRDYFADQGGPIVMAQIENELWNSDKDYINWCGKLAMELDSNIPWVMCNGDTADEAINAFNGDVSTDFLSHGGQTGRILVDQPGVWTENEGWFQGWGAANADREGYYGWDSKTPEDYVINILKFFYFGGTYHNYYMWFGGNHYGTTAGSGQTTWYADGVPIHSDTLPNEPKHTHVNKLHYFLASIADILVNDDAQVHKEKRLENDIRLYTYTYNNKTVYFLENPEPSGCSTTFMNTTYNFRSYEVLAINEKNQVIYASNDVEPAKVTRKTTPVSSLSFKYWNEPIHELSESLPAIVLSHASEQINITRDLTDYLYYETNYDFTQEKNTLDIGSVKAQVFVVYIDGKKVGENNEHSHTWGWATISISFSVSIGTHKITIISESLGLDNQMLTAGDPSWNPERLKGICGWIKMNGVDFFNQEWKHYNGLYGESLKVYTEEGMQKVDWKEDLENAAPITWLSSAFETPKDLKRGIEVLFHPMGLMRGHTYINGHDIGKYWMIKADNGDYSQDYYHIPKDWLRYDGKENSITVIETSGASSFNESEICITQLVPKEN
ncbi:hypothetical protein WA158_002208 [Blastocystis sp. Blastoise]